MKAGVIFTGTGPILILTTYESFRNDEFVAKLAQKGINKYIAFDVDPELARKRYGQHYDAILKDVKQEDDLRVLDYNGHNVFYVFSFDELGEPQFVEKSK